jgi:alpha-glucosidase (family GH31 glycosyl hydrolase)
MRAMWLHYPTDKVAGKIGDQFLWGRDLLIAPVYQKRATTRTLYLPAGLWYDWWTHTKYTGEQSVARQVDLATLPLFVRAGAIIPFDPIRQYSSEKINEPTTIKIFTGADGQFTLYDDDGISQEYLQGKGSWINIVWNEKLKQVSLSPMTQKGFNNAPVSTTFTIQLIPGNEMKTINYKNKAITTRF